MLKTAHHLCEHKPKERIMESSRLNYTNTPYPRDGVRGDEGDPERSSRGGKRNGFYELLGHLIDARNRFRFSFDGKEPPLD